MSNVAHVVEQLTAQRARFGMMEAAQRSQAMFAARAMCRLQFLVSID
jgi:hypothetical protein